MGYHWKSKKMRRAFTMTAIWFLSPQSLFSPSPSPQLTFPVSLLLCNSPPSFTKLTSCFFCLNVVTQLKPPLILEPQKKNVEQVPNFSDARAPAFQRLWVWPSNWLFSGLSLSFFFFSTHLCVRVFWLWKICFIVKKKKGVRRGKEAEARDSKVHRLHPLQAPKTHF